MVMDFITPRRPTLVSPFLDRQRKPMRITRFGQPVAEIVPPLLKRVPKTGWGLTMVTSDERITRSADVPILANR
jgi:hypothetical protein